MEWKTTAEAVVTCIAIVGDQVDDVYVIHTGFPRGPMGLSPDFVLVVIPKLGCKRSCQIPLTTIGDAVGIRVGL
jgi:hypothetical protein